MGPTWFDSIVTQLVEENTLGSNSEIIYYDVNKK